jgi:hypothetical protein
MTIERALTEEEQQLLCKVFDGPGGQLQRARDQIARAIVAREEFNPAPALHLRIVDPSSHLELSPTRGPLIMAEGCDAVGTIAQILVWESDGYISLVEYLPVGADSLASTPLPRTVVVHQVAGELLDP